MLWDSVCENRVKQMEVDNYCKQRSCGTASVNPKTRTNRKISVAERNRENQKWVFEKKRLLSRKIKRNMPFLKVYGMALIHNA